MPQKDSGPRQQHHRWKPSPQGDIPKVIREKPPVTELYFYQKSQVVYQMTFVFCERFLPPHGDRTVDQMVQAARSGKQNIVEGSEDGKTSTEMEIKLINVARSSLQELREDYEDFLTSRKLTMWDSSHPRYNGCRTFCHHRNKLSDYEQFFHIWDAETMANTALTLCHMIDKMITSYLKTLERTFVEQGGIKERMYAARTGYRQHEDQLRKDLQRENEALQQENEALKAEIARLTSLLKT